MEETTKQTPTIKEKLSDIDALVNWKEVSEQYFGHSKAWMYQRMGGNVVGGKPARFTDEQLVILRKALVDMARRLTEASERI